MLRRAAQPAQGAARRRRARAPTLRPPASTPSFAPWIRSDQIGSDHAPTFLIEHDLFRKPAPTFRDHALAR
ncbi:MAG: hypothetical protein GEU91_18835 [Rhizobiales bacterium]|nr:hypothetical protein [Hyphomicrobiales bacterium]